MRLAPHLHRIGNDIVAAYLIVTDNGITLVDAGLPGQFADLRAELTAVGRSFDDIRGLVVTHGDSDHLGFAERLRRDHGVPVHVHAADADIARGGQTRKLSMTGARPGPILRFAAYGLRKGAFSTRDVAEVVEMHDGDELDLPGAPRIVGMPGHTPGSVAVYSPLADAVFVGDALVTRSVLTGRRGPQPAPFTADPALALASLDRLAALEASWVLPGHGDPWRGSPADAVAAVRAAA